MSDPLSLELLVAESISQSNLPNGPLWRPSSLSQGYAGIALMFAHFDRCFPNNGWNGVADAYLALAVDGARLQVSSSASAFNGIAGLLFVSWYHRNGQNREALITEFTKSLLNQTGQMLESLDGRSGVSVNEIDIVSGVSGALTVLLTCCSSKVIEDIIGHAGRVFSDLTDEQNFLPRWHSPAHLCSPLDSMTTRFPKGFLNCGMAHGIPGPLFALSLAKILYPSNMVLSRSIRRIANWLIRRAQLSDAWGPNWPHAIPIDDRSSASPSQAGWCYGAPGISRALSLAGIAEGEAEYVRASVVAMESVLNRPESARLIVSPTLCHGTAGLLQIGLRHLDECVSEQTRDVIAIARNLVDQFDEFAPLGYRSIEMDGVRVDQPGFLDGSPGVALALLSVSECESPSWDRILAIA